MASTRSLPASALNKRSRGSRRAATGDPVAASRALFFDLLAPSAADAGKPALVEMSCFTIASAPGLARIFPEARFVHAVRDGRDSGSSKAAKRQKEHHPTGVADGIDWWLGRLRLAEEGVRGLAIPGAWSRSASTSSSGATVSAPTATCCGFLELSDEPAMREFFSCADERRRGPSRALARGISEPDQEVISRR